MLQSAASSAAQQPLLQSTASMNIVFVNIDWKRARHDTCSSTQRNLKQLNNTVQSIVSRMKPAVLCCCEVGHVMQPLTLAQLQKVEDTIQQAWEDAATEHVTPDIRFLHAVGQPYITAWDANLTDCRHPRILRKLYSAGTEPRTAQAFMCSMPGESDKLGLDVINVHAPSGRKKLTDTQRMQLLQNLLQSNSICNPSHSIGRTKFLIGGDMNTKELELCTLLNKLQAKGLLQPNHRVMRPLWGHHGDMCVQSGLQAQVIENTATNHDPMHTPYGIRWCIQPQHATDQLAATLPTSRGKDADRNSMRHATEQPSQAPAPYSQKNTMSYLNVALATSSTEQLAPALPTSRGNDADRSSLWHATEQPSQTPAPYSQENAISSFNVTLAVSSQNLRTGTQFAADHEPKNNVTLAAAGLATEQTQPDAEQRPAAEKATEQPDSDREKESDRPDVLAAAGPATEQPQPDAEQRPTAENATKQPDSDTEEDSDRPDQELAYAIINAFLGQLTWDNTAVESLLRDAIRDETQWPPEMLQNIDEVFRPIFFHYPNGLQDRTTWTPRDACTYIKHWREQILWREHVDTQANNASSPMHLDTQQVQTVFQEYIADFIANVATPEQKSRPFTYLKSCSEARLRTLCGTRLLAFAIWEIGLPDTRVPSLATEQRQIADSALSTEEQRQIEDAIHNVLTWLDLLAEGIQKYRQKPEYQRAVQKAGTRHGESGLTATEHEAKKAMLRAKKDLRTAKMLARKWERWELTVDNVRPWQWTLLQELWKGTLDERVAESIRDRSPTQQSKLPIIGRT